MPGMPSIESAQQAWRGQISKKLSVKKLTGAGEEKSSVGKVWELEEVSLLGLGGGGGRGLCDVNGGLWQAKRSCSLDGILEKVLLILLPEPPQQMHYNCR